MQQATSMNVYFKVPEAEIVEEKATTQGAETVMSIIRRTQPVKEEKAKRVLIIDQSITSQHMVRSCIEAQLDNCDARIAINNDSVKKILSSFSPDLIVADWETLVLDKEDEEIYRLAVDHNTPVLLLINEDDLCTKSFWRHFSSSIVDCIRKPIIKDELKARIRLLLKFTEQMNRMRMENRSIKEELNLKHFELHLELLMHSGSVKNKFLEEVAQLSSYLNNEGRLKLKNLTRQFRWALNEENSTNSLITFDKMNESLFKKIESLGLGITKNEKRLCALLLKNQAGSEIAKVMGKTQNCINVAFARLRAKLKMADNKALKAFIHSLAE